MMEGWKAWYAEVRGVSVGGITGWMRDLQDRNTESDRLCMLDAEHRQLTVTFGRSVQI
jgi:hypothetical protein